MWTDGLSRHKSLTPPLPGSTCYVAQHQYLKRCRFCISAPAGWPTVRWRNLTTKVYLAEIKAVWVCVCAANALVYLLLMRGCRVTPIAKDISALRQPLLGWLCSGPAYNVWFLCTAPLSPLNLALFCPPLRSLLTGGRLGTGRCAAFALARVRQSDSRRHTWMLM